MTDEERHDMNLLAKSLREVLSYVKKHGAIEMEHEDEVFVIAVKREHLPDRAREFLMKGGPAG